jgi:hypothetical protein
VPFELPFNQITGLSQSAYEAQMGPGVGLISGNPMQLSVHAKALIMKPSGMMPQYALMAYIQCSLGAQAQKTVTRNLGAFIQHVAGLNPKTVSLEAPGNSGDRAAREGVSLAFTWIPSGRQGVTKSICAFLRENAA